MLFSITFARGAATTISSTKVTESQPSWKRSALKVALLQNGGQRMCAKLRKDGRLNTFDILLTKIITYRRTRSITATLQLSTDNYYYGCYICRFVIFFHEHPHIKQLRVRLNSVILRCQQVFQLWDFFIMAADSDCSPLCAQTWTASI